MDSKNLELEIDKITVNDGRRELDMKAVKELAKSIRELGIMNPIIVDTKYNLIAGLHRLEAVKLLGHEKIKCTIMDLRGLQAELAEIDENFVRSPLSEREQCKVLSRRKQIYEKLHPETKHGGDHMSGKSKIASCNLAPEPIKSFVRDTAEKLGISETSVARRVRIGEKVTPEAMAAFDNHDEKFSQREALKLARIAPEQQKEAAEQYVSGEIHTISDYKPVETNQTDQANRRQTDKRQSDTRQTAEEETDKRQTVKEQMTEPSARNAPDIDEPKSIPLPRERTGAESQPIPVISKPQPPPVTIAQESESAAPPVPETQSGRKSAPEFPKSDTAASTRSPAKPSRTESGKSIAASYKDPVIGRIVADLKDADKERPLTADMFVSDFDSVVKTLIRGVEWFDIQEYQDIFPKLTEDQYQSLREIEKRANSCLDTFLKTVREKMNA